MMSKELEIIIQKYLGGEFSEEELDILIKAFSEEDIREQFEKSVEINYMFSMKYKKIGSKAAYLDFRSRTQGQRTLVNRKRRGRVAIFKYAAVFLALIGLGYFFLVEQQMQEESSPLLQIKEKAITLQFDNGKIKVIDENGVTQVLDKEGNRVATQKDNKITYNSDSEVKELVYNELNIPYGKKFQIELSDGTLVYLNSGSSLKYPVNFIKGEQRQVFVKGEAYFKVAEDANTPFIVNAGQVNIRVLGTEFNVSSYEEDENVNTVLVSGKVQLYDASNSYEPQTSTDIAPNQIGSWSKLRKEFGVQEVDADIYTAWMTGKLVFRNMSFKTIRKKLERHYNVVILNNNKELDDNTFNAAFDIESIEEVLETFGRNFGIKYKILDNQIIIYQPKKE
ncbi:MAG: FecR domain-containing protein [Flavobacteriaceae bacterium]